MEIIFQQPQVSKNKRNASVSFRLNLIVPFAEKESVKKLGGRWDPSSKSWYVIITADRSVLSFQKWLKSPILV